MIDALKQLETWHQKPASLAIFGLLELGLGYLMFSLAVNSGSLWQWTLALIAFISALRNAFLLIKHRKDGRKK